MFVTAGFIVGFDSEKTDVGDSIAHFIDLSAIPVAMVGAALCVAQAHTPPCQGGPAFTPIMTSQPTTGGDQCTTGP